MGRGAASKSKRKEQRKESKKNGDVGIFDDNGRMMLGESGMEENGSAEGFGSSDDIPLPPGMAAEEEKLRNDDSSSDDSYSNKNSESRRNDAEELIKIRKKKAKSSCCGGGNDDKEKAATAPKKKDEGIKTTPLILLLLLVGTAVLPALIYAGDYIGAIFQRNHVLGNIGFRLGIGAVPKKRVLSFYEKHDPNKLNEVPAILSKYYGDYPKLIKRLERKYQDYGYFLDWQNDEAPMTIVKEQIAELYTIWIRDYWNRYAPQLLKTAARNARYNLTFLHKKLRKVWKKKLWPLLEPFLGVPKGGERQKRMDAAEAKMRREEMKKATNRGGGGGSSSSSTRRRSSAYRDDDEM